MILLHVTFYPCFFSTMTFVTLNVTLTLLLDLMFFFDHIFLQQSDLHLTGPFSNFRRFSPILISLFWTSGYVFPGFQSQGGTLACMTGPICLPLFQSLDLFCLTLPCCITLTLCLSGHRPILSSGTRCPCRVFVCFFDFWFILAKSKRTNWERH